ncbi:DMT family transporter [Celeribacter sp.]|uniref:DMT family transporter n=1 Tax=Celeribacter sp. TaxID=1890673 RepID=UPI003A945E13
MGTIRPREERLTAGVLIMIAAVTCFTGIDTSAKWLSLYGLPVMQIVFVRYAMHFALSVAFFVPREGLSAFRSNVPKKQLLRSAALMLSTFMNFWALSYLPLSLTISIAFATPMVVTLLAIPLLGEKVGLRRIAAVITGFVGVLIVVQPWGVGFHWAVILSLHTLVFASFYYVMTRMIAGEEANSTMQLWSSGLATLALFPLAAQNWVWPHDSAGWIVMGLIGTFGMLGHVFVTTANRFADASVLSPMIYTQLISATIVGYIVFGSLPTWWTLIGATIIIGSGLYIWNRERVTQGVTPT